MEILNRWEIYQAFKFEWNKWIWGQISCTKQR